MKNPIEKIRKLRPKKKPKAKKVWSEQALQARDKFGFRPRDYLYVIVISALVFCISYFLYHQDATKSILWTALAAIIALLVLRKLAEAQEGGKEVIGWLIVWKDRAGFYNNVPPFHNMKMVYGRAVQLDDNNFESIPNSIYMTYYMKKDLQKSFNPMLDAHMRKLAEMKKNGERVIWCDGTDKFNNPLQAMSFRDSLKESKGLTSKNIKKTTQWMLQKQNVQPQ